MTTCPLTQKKQRLAALTPDPNLPFFKWLRAEAKRQFVVPSELYHAMAAKGLVPEDDEKTEDNAL